MAAVTFLQPETTRMGAFPIPAPSLPVGVSPTRPDHEELGSHVGNVSVWWAHFQQDEAKWSTTPRSRRLVLLMFSPVPHFQQDEANRLSNSKSWTPRPADVFPLSHCGGVEMVRVLQPDAIKAPASPNVKPLHPVDVLPPDRTRSRTTTIGYSSGPVGSSQQEEATPVAAPSPHSLPPADAFLALFADALDDFEDLRIRNENRARALRQMKGDKGGDQYFRLLEVIERMCAEEHVIELELGRVLRAHPLGGWVRRTVGVGAKQGARLLAAIGDPFWHPVFDRPRLVSELWAFCGYHVLNPGQSMHDLQMAAARVDPLNPGHSIHDPQRTSARVDLSDPAQKSHDNQVSIGGVAPRKTRGQQANWSNTAKMRCYLVATSCIKQAHSPYRSVYDAGRAKYAESTHNAVCPRCGPTGRPAQPGSPLSLGHQHARAMRLVSKAVLKDLWLESRRIHYETAT